MSQVIRLNIRFKVVIALVLLLLFVVPGVAAAALHQTDDPTGLTDVLGRYLLIGGSVAAGVTALLNILKTLRIVPDGAAPALNTLLNIAGFVAFGASGVFGLDLTQYGPVIDAVVKVIVSLAALIGQPVLSAAIHDRAAKAKLPIIGFSHTQKRSTQPLGR